ncbi:MAG: ATP-binding cassette domain-containing protein [Bacteroidetes bacterium]|nr:ATP-binding cassette domain-containing protein [Bacteroidota bacterium]
MVRTQIGDKGTKLSGGQKQRLAIARALYHRPQILIFDEATSALDEESEKEITEAIKELNNSNITIIVVAHRIQTLKYCNKVFLLNEGVLVETDVKINN